MALIQCPECGGTVSDKAESCIHCGAKLTVCPECGNVLIGNVETCMNCGYKLSGASASITGNKENLPQKPQEKKARKPINFEKPWGIGYGISGCTVVMFIVGMIIVSVYYHGVGYTPMEAASKGARMWRIGGGVGIIAVILLFIGRLGKSIRASEHKAAKIVFSSLRFIIGLGIYIAIVFGALEAVFAFSLWSWEADVAVALRLLLIFVSHLAVVLIAFQEVIFGMISTVKAQREIEKKQKEKKKKEPS